MKVRLLFICFCCTLAGWPAFAQDSARRLDAERRQAELQEKRRQDERRESERREAERQEARRDDARVRATQEPSVISLRALAIQYILADRSDDALRVLDLGIRNSTGEEQLTFQRMTQQVQEHLRSKK